MKMNRQGGMATVEFAIVAAVTLTTIFAVIEFGRILFMLNVLDEGARRATRVAAVCAVQDAAITDAAMFMTMPGLTPTNIVTDYLDTDGVPLGDPAGADYPQISYVRVRIENYSFPVALPFVATLFSAPQISATLPRESLGVPNFGAAPAC
jgi:hypothetical protein